ncbi:zinc finger protein 764 [Aedes albopictus]|uniref:C2h2-type zn-finger protein n=1 Tax=Aedes albopictus TaxID=7160 RepID=A0ABM1ZPP1_AEDAL
MDNSYPKQFEAFVNRNRKPAMASSSSKGSQPKRLKTVEEPIVTVPTGNPLTFCRLCFSNNVARRLTVKETIENWIEYIAENAGIQMDIEEDPCFAVCFGCTTGLESVSQFRDKCQNRDMALRMYRAQLAAPKAPPPLSFISDKQILISNVMTLAPVQPQPATVIPPPPVVPSELVPTATATQSIVPSVPPVPPEATMITCYACDLKIPIGLPYMKHMKMFHRVKGKLLQCPQCDKRFRKSELFQRHVMKHKPHTPLGKKCRVCYSYFRTTEELDQHQIYAHDLQFKCRICYKRFATQREKVIHKEVHKSELPRRTYRCKMCSLTFPNGHLLNKHVNKHERYIVCPACEKACAGLEQYLSHQTIDHQNGSCLTECAPCQVSFQNYAELRVHMVAKHTGYDPNAIENDEEVSSDPDEGSEQVVESEAPAAMETVSLSDEDQEDPEANANDDDDADDDELFPAYLEGEEEDEQEGDQPEGTEAMGDAVENELMEDELTLEDAIPDNGFDLYGTAFPRQITITLDDSSG